MRAVSSERAAKRSGVGRKEKKIGWWVPWMEKKEREKNSGIGLRKRNILWWSGSGRGRGEERWERSGEEAVRGVEVQVGKESWTRNGTV